jgi:hypothetical protein
MFIKIGKRLLQILGINYILDWLKRINIFPSGVLLILVNLIPIFGVLYLNWNAYDVIVLYWVENIVIGICNIPRILLAQKRTFTNPFLGRGPGEFDFSDFAGNLFMSGFFTIHYGVFTLVHGIFILNLIARKSTFLINKDFSGITVFFIALLISHGYSLITNYIVKEEYKHRSAQEAMMKPYGRVIVIHLTIILGAIISQILPSVLIIIFVLMKTLFDLGLHLKSHYNSSPKYNLDILEKSSREHSLDLSNS